MPKKQSATPFVVAIRQMAELRAMDLNSVVTFCSEALARGQAAYIESAKAIVQLVDLLAKTPGTRKTYATVLALAGVRESSIKNGKKLADLWPLLVEPGYIPESAFDSINFMECLAVRTLIKKKMGIATESRGLPQVLPPHVADQIAAHILNDRDELESYASYGMTRAEYQAVQIAKAQAEADALAAAQRPAPAPVSPTAPVDAPPVIAAEAPAAATATAPKSAPAAPAPVVETPAQAPAPAPAPAPAATPPASNVVKMPDLAGWKKQVAAIETQAITMIAEHPGMRDDVFNRIIALGQTIATALAAVGEEVAAEA